MAMNKLEYFNPGSPKQVKKFLLSEGIRLPDTSEATLEANKDRHPLISEILKLRTLAKLKGTYIDGYRKHITAENLIHSEYSVEGTETGRCHSRNPNVQNVPKSARVFFTSRFEGGKLVSPDCSALEYRLIGHETKDAILLQIFREGWDIHRMAATFITGKPQSEIDDDLRREMKTVNYAACLIPGSRVLTSSLEWVPIETLQAGDGLVAFDENHRDGYGRESCRQWKNSKVESSSRAIKPCYRVTMDNGDTFVASEDHRLITKYVPSTSGSRKSGWKEVKKLLVRQQIPKYLDIWTSNNDYTSGWLGGIFDGEGNIASKGQSLTVSQNPGDVSNYIESCVDALGFLYTKSLYTNGVNRIHIGGGLKTTLNFLGLVKSRRLITNTLKWFDRQDGPIFQAKEYVKVKSIEYVGEKEVIVLETSTKTYIAEGYAMHNCYGAGKDKFYNMIGRVDEELFYKAKGLYPGVNTYNRRIEAQLGHTGKITNIFGRQRHFTGEIDYSTLLEAFNWIFQSSGHLVLKAMVIRWYKEIGQNDALDCVKLAQEGHDSVIFDVHPSYVEDVARMVKETDLNRVIEEDLGVKMLVPMLIDVKISSEWK